MINVTVPVELLCKFLINEPSSQGRVEIKFKDLCVHLGDKGLDDPRAYIEVANSQHGIPWGNHGFVYRRPRLQRAI